MLVSKNFGDIVTFARASARWRYSNGGVLVQDAANVPSMDYEPVTLAARGMLVEEARTNLVLNSGAFTGWNVQGSTLAPPSAAAPDGGLARKLVSSVTSSTVCQAYFPSVPTTAGSSYSFSSYFKAGEYTAAYLNSNLTGGYLSAVFDLLTGATKSGAGLTASMVPAGNGWWRCTVTGAAASTAAQIAVGGASNYAGANTGTGPATGSVFDGVSGLYIWGAQFEAGTFASGYIPTTSAQATRAADSAIITDLSKIGFNPSEGTLYAEVEFGTGSNRALTFSDGTINNQIWIAQATCQVYLGGASQATWTINAPNGKNKIALAYKVGDSAVSVNGGAATVQAPTAIPVLSRLILGQNASGAGSLNGWLRNARYIPRRMSNVELQALTT